MPPAGRTTRNTIQKKTYVPLVDVLTEVFQKIEEEPPPDYITLSGSGEPTLYTRLDDLIRVTKEKTGIPLAVITRLVRSSMLDVIRQDYVTTLRAKGLPERQVIYGHALRNALPPIVSITGLQAGFLLGGALFTEVIFSWPDIGRQLYSSILARDVPVVQGAMLIISFTFVLLNLAADVLVAYLDPKLRAG